MKRMCLALLFTSLLVLVLAPAAFADGIQGRAGRSNSARLDLSSNCAMHPDAWGNIVYTLSGPRLDFVLGAYNLPVDGEYKLYYGDGHFVPLEANPSGALHLAATVDGSGVAPNARFELYHMHQHTDDAPCEQCTSHQHDGMGCLLLVSDPHGYVYTP